VIDRIDELSEDVNVHDMNDNLHRIEQVTTSLLEEGYHVIEGGVLAKPIECDAEEVMRREWCDILMALTHR
jgi:hypothetical protein